jgi:hypothetical protein
MQIPDDKNEAGCVEGGGLYMFELCKVWRCSFLAKD